MTSYAVIATGGKQYIVEPGKAYTFEKLAGNVGDTVAFQEVLLTFGDDGADVRVGTPHIAGVTVAGTIEEQGRAKKVRVIKYKAKSRYRRLYGHRQPYTKVAITGVTVHPSS